MMKSVVAVFAGMMIGGIFLNTSSGSAAVLIGGCLGYTFYAISSLSGTVKALRRELDLLRAAHHGEAPDRARKEEMPPSPQEQEQREREHRRGEEAGFAFDLEGSLARAETARKAPAQRPTPPASHANTPPLHRTPSEPEFVLPDWLGRLLNGENLLVKLGVVILFFGVAFLVKYAAQHGMFPVELRLIATAIGGCALLAGGWRLREKRAGYAQAIQGGGGGILYLTTFAAMRLYHFIPTAAGFGILAALCILTAFLAVLQNAPALALLATAGGFLAPQLASLGSGSHVVLFSYYALLNAGIFGIAWFRAWRELNVLGFVCTFVVSAIWGARFYRPEYFATVEPFLILFFLGYTAVAILFARRQPGKISDYLDGTLVFGTPILAFALQAALVKDFEYGLAWSAVGLAVFYLSLAAVLFRKAPPTMRLFGEAFLAFGVVFATLAIPLAFDGRWTAAAWSVEGAGLVWAGLRQERQLARGFGYFLIFGSAWGFLKEASLPTGPWPVLNGFYCGCLLVSAAAFFSAYLLRRHNELLASRETGMEQALFAWGVAWWYLSGLNEIELHTLPDYTAAASLAFIALSCGVSCFLRPRLLWPLLDLPALALLPVMLLFTAYLGLTDAGHPAAGGGYLAWPLSFAVWYYILKSKEEMTPDLLDLAHAAALWLLALLMAWEIYWQIGHRDLRLVTWAEIAWGVVPAALGLLIARRGEVLPWPVSSHYSTYLGKGSGPLIGFTWLWAVSVNLTEAGDPGPLPYIPVLNPLDLATLLVMAVLPVWYLKTRHTLPLLFGRFPHRELRISYGLTIFLWLTAALLRTIHHWSGIPFTATALFNSLLVQMSLSVFWGLTALAVMIIAARRALRPLWIAGAALLGIVVGKLFLVDLASHGSIERIVSFVAVGILLLVIGWFTPVPPRAQL